MLLSDFCNIASLFSGGMTLVWIWNRDCLTVLFVPIFTYGSESWTLQKHGKSAWCLWKLLAQKNYADAYKDRITNETIRQRTQHVPVSNRIREVRLKWLGHVLWMKDRKLTKRVDPYTSRVQPGKDQEATEQKMDGLYWRGPTTSRCNKVWKTAGRHY